MSASWLNRDALPAAKQANGIVFSEEPATGSVAASVAELDYLRNLSRENWALAGIKNNDRVIVSTHHSGSFPVAMHAEVLGPLCDSVFFAGPRARLRLLHSMKQFKPRVWVTTPCAALDFLASLYMEFNVDPFEIGIEHIVLTGEIASPGTHKRLADEFEAEVTDLYCDPLYGAALAVRQGSSWQCANPEVLALAATDSDTLLCDGIEEQSALAEIVLRLPVESLSDKIIRSGQLLAPESSYGLFHHTRGNDVLARGRWISLPLIDQALKLIDGVQHWQLCIERGEGTLDRLTLKLGLNRETLVDNPMWKSRIREAMTAICPVRIEATTYLVDQDNGEVPQRVDDQRGYHLSNVDQGAPA
jgi:phenylacetate-CoA ligase